MLQYVVGVKECKIHTFQCYLLYLSIPTTKTYIIFFNLAHFQDKRHTFKHQHYFDCTLCQLPRAMDVEGFTKLTLAFKEALLFSLKTSSSSLFLPNFFTQSRT